MISGGKVRVVRFFSKALVGAQLNWSVIEKECYGIFYGVRLFEDLLDNIHFILKTGHKNLTYLNVTLTGKVLRWKLYLQDQSSPAVINVMNKVKVSLKELAYSFIDFIIIVS